MTTDETQNLTRIHHDARSAYEAGRQTPDGIANPDDAEFLKTIGIRPNSSSTVWTTSRAMANPI